jgi:hypothetical protein
MNRIIIPRGYDNNIFLVVVVVVIIVEFVIIDWLWFRLLLLFLEPAEAKEDYIWSVSVVHTDSIGLVNDGVRTHEPKGI